jgi:DNA primase
MRWIDALVEYAQENLNGDRELESLWSRGVSDEQIRDFKVGYLSNELPTLEGGAGLEDFLKWYRGNGKKVWDVYVFPLTNALGQVKGVQFRHVERAARGYTDFYLSKDEPAFFGLAQSMPHVWRTGTILLVEGVFDFFPVQRVFPQAMSSMTAAVSSNFARFLKRNVREVWLGYDRDAAGRDGAFKFVEEHGKEYERVRVGQLPALMMANGKRTKDPSDLWELLGDDRFGVYVKSAFGQR